MPHMRGTTQRIAMVVVWVLAFTFSIFSARYFLMSADDLAKQEDSIASTSARMLDAPPIPTTHPKSNHPVLLLAHIAGGTIAITFGLFQFSSKLRDSLPKVHRAIGYFYVGAVAVGSLAGFPLALMFSDPLPPESRAHLVPAVFGFASLSAVWPVTTLFALVRARQLRFDEHRAWMLRSYCLTFSFVTVRLFAPAMLLLTHDSFNSVNFSVLSWPLNLVIAEWLIRRSERGPGEKPQGLETAAAAAAAK